MKDATTKLMKEAILFAVSSISEDVTHTTDIDKNKQRAEVIKTLAEAYFMVCGVK